MFAQRRHAVVVAAVITTVTMGGGMLTAVELAAHPAHPQPTIVQPGPATAPAAPTYEDVAASDR